jgi:hypothetical protein
MPAMPLPPAMRAHVLAQGGAEGSVAEGGEEPDACTLGALARRAIR